MTSNKHGRNRRPSGVEALESRVLMDGAISALLQGGDLIIRGDAEDNHAVITRAAAGKVRIEGRDGTTINGKAFVNVGPITDDLTVLMQQGGADLVAIQGPFGVPDDVTARLGAGEFLVEGSLGPVNVGGDLEVETGEDGVVNVRNDVSVSDELSIDAGADANVVSGSAFVPDFAAARFDNPLKINNPYFPLVPGAVYTYESKGIDDDTDEPFTERIVVEVLPATKTIQGVKTRVVRDRVFLEGRLIEDTFDWYAQDNGGNVWYFGEDVTNVEYDEAGNAETNKDGSWIAGVDKAQAGTIMEAKPRVGHRYYQEFAPGNVLDTGVGLATDARVRVPAGSFKNAFRSEEATVTEPFVLANKLYAPGVGTVMELDYDVEDNEVAQSTKLVSLTLNGKPVKQVVPTSGFRGVNANGRLVGGARVGESAEIEADGAISINGAELRGPADIDSGAEVLLVNTEFARDVEIEAEEAVTLRSVFADAAVRVGGKSDVFVFDSQINRLIGRFGDADNDLTLQDSLFDLIDADGGGGENKFAEWGGNVIETLRLRRFARA